MTSSRQAEEPEQPSVATGRVPWTTNQRARIIAGVAVSAILWGLTPLAYNPHSFLSGLVRALAALATLSVASYAWITADRNRRDASDRHQVERDRAHGALLRRLYDRQEELGGAILEMLRDEAGAMEQRHATFTTELLAKQAATAEEQLSRQAAQFKVLLDRQRQASDATLRAMERSMGSIAESIRESLAALEESWSEYNALVRKVRSRVGEVSREIRAVSVTVRHREQAAEERSRELARVAKHLEEMLEAHALLISGRVPDAKVRPIKRPVERPIEGQNGS